MEIESAPETARFSFTLKRRLVEKSGQHRLATVEMNALHRQELRLGDKTAGCGKSARLVARRQHPMTRHDDWPGIARHGRTDRLRGSRRTSQPGKLPIGDGLASPHLAQRVIDRRFERGDTGEIQKHA